MVVPVRFKWAVCQHPMTLIIKEDETSLERIPPYGAESFHAYYLKIKENLDYLKEHEFAKVCFETSILETMFILDSYPEIKELFVDLIKQGKLSFVGGTYGQVHSQTLTSESNFRQFELGLEKYRELFGIDIRLYAVQEPGHHEQMPQLLKAFGIKFATLPTFTYSLIFLEEYELVSFMEMAWMKFTKNRGMEQDQITRLCFTKNNEFAMWAGLDGTEIPLYLIDPMRWCRREDIRNEYKKDLYSSPPVRLYLTDLLDFNPEIVNETLESADFVLADRAIAKRYRKSGRERVPRVRLYSYYSYLEGSKADKAYVNNRSFEDLVLGAQSLEAYLRLNNLPGIPYMDWEEAWRVLLETQHHDICYPDAPLLQEWATEKIANCIFRLNPGIEKLKVLLSNLSIHLKRKKAVPERKNRRKMVSGNGWGCREDNDCRNGDDGGKGGNDSCGGLVIFNCMPHDITCVVKLDIHEKPSGTGKLNKAPINENPVLQDSSGRFIDCQTGSEDGDKYLYFIDTVNGFGAKTLKFLSSDFSSTGISSGNPIYREEKTKKGEIVNRFYRCDVNAKGEIKNILINDGERTGTGENFKYNKRIIFEDRANMLAASFCDGSPVKFKVKPGRFRQENGKVYDLVETEGTFDRSCYKREAKFYRQIPRIDFKITFDFDNQQVGNFFLEETKLCTVWSVKGLKKIRHDIPFGVVMGRKSRPLYALTWINCEMENSASFTILPKGKIKFFEKDGLLYNLLAWGDEGVDFMRVGGTCAPEILKGHFDLRLDGRYSFEYSLYIHKATPGNQELFRIAAALARPFISVYSENFSEPDEDIIFKFRSKNIFSTSVFSNSRKVKCRFFECNGSTGKIDIIKRKGINATSIKDISGAEIDRLGPFKIAEMSIS
ncbi:MAG: hypothetical protein FJW66_00785 [Actinobacteria bacterium]|nr:hypothetical protein [Actinomycetota bacterium]